MHARGTAAAAAVRGGRASRVAHAQSRRGCSIAHALRTAMQRAVAAAAAAELDASYVGRIDNSGVACGVPAAPRPYDAGTSASVGKLLRRGSAHAARYAAVERCGSGDGRSRRTRAFVRPTHGGGVRCKPFSSQRAHLPGLRRSASRLRAAVGACASALETQRCRSRAPSSRHTPASPRCSPGRRSRANSASAQRQSRGTVGRAC